MIGWSWKPDRLTRTAIRRGDKINRKYLARKEIQYHLALIERLARIEQQAGGRP